MLQIIFKKKLILYIALYIYTLYFNRCNEGKEETTKNSTR